MLQATANTTIESAMPWQGEFTLNGRPKSESESDHRVWYAKDLLNLSTINCG
jgi:hypothetical protein